MDEYTKFLEGKFKLHVPTGIEKPVKIHNRLFPFQSLLTSWALRRGRAALFESTGLGKTIQQLEFARHVEKHTKRPVLILAPLAVAQQTAQEAKHHLSLEVKFASGDADISERGVYVTNYQKLHKFDPDRFSGVVLDECFPPDTLVEFLKDGIVLKKPISTIQENDIIINASGRDRVIECHRRKVERAVKISVGKNSITASENHPFFTQRGWVSAIELARGDYFVETSEAMRLVLGGGDPEIPGSVGSQVLRDILLSEMADAANTNPESRTQPRVSEEERGLNIEMVRGRERRGVATIGASSITESYDKSRGSGEGQSDVADDEIQTYRAWREWSRDDEAAGIALGGAIRRMDSGICLITWQKDAGLSDVLQIGLGTAREENLHRSGWSEPFFSQGSGHEEGCKAGFVRVEGIEVLERGHPELEQWRDADGFVYFHDLKAERHPSFSVEGFLVHNSSILKGFDRATASLLIASFKDTPFRLVCTATPAPNDIAEIGAYAEFLGVMSMSEMLATFFINDSGDTSKWRLKGHAETEFWRWMASWAACVTLPSDIGCDDTGYILPPLNTHEVVVKSKVMSGELFAVHALSMDERRGARRDSITERVQAAFDLIASKPGEQWTVWCGLNQEQDAIAASLKGDCASIQGSTPDDAKVDLYEKWKQADFGSLVTKVELFGFGCNMQQCHNTIFLGLSDSFEKFYQAVRRHWRFGQKSEVNAYIIISEAEGAVLANIKRKQAEAEKMQRSLVEHMREFTKRELGQQTRQTIEYNPTKKMVLPSWIKSE